MAFLVESSESIPADGFQKIKDFIKDAVKYLLTIEGEQQVGVILYSNEATKQINFGQYQSVFDFNEAINNLPHEKGQARLDKALRFASSKVFTDDKGKALHNLTINHLSPSSDQYGISPCRISCSINALLSREAIRINDNP